MDQHANGDDDGRVHGRARVRHDDDDTAAEADLDDTGTGEAAPPLDDV